MAVSVQMPALGESVTEGTVTRWLKQEGDAVVVDEPLLEVSTDKVDTEIRPRHRAYSAKSSPTRTTPSRSAGNWRSSPKPVRPPQSAPAAPVEQPTPAEEPAAPARTGSPRSTSRPRRRPHRPPRRLRPPPQRPRQPRRVRDAGADARTG